MGVSVVTTDSAKCRRFMEANPWLETDDVSHFSPDDYRPTIDVCLMVGGEWGFERDEVEWLGEFVVVLEDGAEHSCRVGRDDDGGGLNVFFVELYEEKVVPDGLERLLGESLYEMLESLTKHRQDWVRTGERFFHFEQLTGAYASYLDRMVNYTEFDHRVYDLARVLRKRLSEFRLKFLRDQQKLLDLCEQHDDFRKARFSTSENTVVWMTADTNEEAEAGRGPVEVILTADLRNCDNRRHRIGKINDRVPDLLEFSMNAAESLAKEADEKVQSSVNMVLYWLSIITLFFGLVTIYDKYLSGETFGVPGEAALWTTYMLLLPLVFFFFLTMLRHGTLSRTLSAWLVWLRLHLAGSTLLRGLVSRTPWLRDKIHNRIGRWWFPRIEWQVTRLVEGELEFMRCAGAPETAEEIHGLHSAEERAFEHFERAWESMEDKLAGMLISSQDPQVTMGGQLLRLRSELLVNLAYDFLFLEMPHPCPSIPIWAVMLLKTRELEATNAYFTAVLRDEIGYVGYFDEMAAFFLDDGELPGTELRKRFRHATVGLLREHWDDCELTDDDLWGLVRSHLLSFTGDMPAELAQVLSDLEVNDIILAYYDMTLASLWGETLGLDQEDSEGASEA